MITREEFEILCRGEVRQAVDRRIDDDPLAVALDKRLPHAALVASQVKYLARARKKLPSYREARCIIPPLAYEQASGEACAMLKDIGGDTALDLTCGLGVDSFALARRFRRIVALERDEVLAEVARENFRRLGTDNVEVLCTSAENFVEQALREGLHFDWIYADPDRRGADGRKKVVAADCSPDVVTMMPQLKALADGVLLKMSPMFDIDEALRVFGPCSAGAVSQNDECKEVTVRIDGLEPSVRASAAGRGSFGVTAAERAAARCTDVSAFDPSKYGWLVQPDVALQKTRLAPLHLAGRADIFSANGYGFAAAKPDGETLGRVYEIERIERYDPRALRREMKGSRVQIMLRDVPLTAAAIMQAAGMREGGGCKLAFTSVGREIWVIRLK